MDYITVISGIPRTGTTLAMQMVGAGGMPLLTDKKRGADEHNPNGYYEFDPVMDLEHNTSWVPQAAGKAVKVVAYWLSYLPTGPYEYRILFMERDLREVMASQNKMRVARGYERDDVEEGIKDWRSHIKGVKEYLTYRDDMVHRVINHHDVITQPRKAANVIVELLSPVMELDVDSMVGVVDPSLYRNRVETLHAGTGQPDKRS